MQMGLGDGETLALRHLQHIEELHDGSGSDSSLCHELLLLVQRVADLTARTNLSIQHEPMSAAYKRLCPAPKAHRVARHHCEGFAGACLAIGKNAHVPAFDARQDELLHVLEYIRLRVPVHAASGKHLVEIEGSDGTVGAQ
jgi:hypothetical protein